MFTSPEEALAMSKYFSAHLFWQGAINHPHSLPPVSLCPADQLDQSALQKKLERATAANKMALLMLIYEVVSLHKLTTHI